LNIGAGQFRVYGNRPTTLANNTFDPMQEVVIYPNPGNDFFSVSKPASQVSLYTLTGQLIKEFGEYPAEYQYPISDLAKGLYLIKITDQDGRSKLSKFVKN